MNNFISVSNVSARATKSQRVKSCKFQKNSPQTQIFFKTAKQIILIPVTHSAISVSHYIPHVSSYTLTSLIPFLITSQLIKTTQTPQILRGINPTRRLFNLQVYDHIKQCPSQSHQ